MQQATDSAAATGLWPVAGTQLRVALDRYPERLLSHVMYEGDGTYLIVAGPMRFSRDIPCQAGEEVELSWVHPRGICSVSTTVVGYELFDIPCWRVRTVGEVQLVQRRMYVRIAAVLPVTVVTQHGRAETTTRDISEGGIGCGLPEELGVAIGDPVTLTMDIGGEPTTLESSAVRVVPEREGSVAVGLSFENVRPAVGDRIRKLVITLQLAERQRAAESALEE